MWCGLRQGGKGNHEKLWKKHLGVGMVVCWS
jgi:hypothetical protein